MLIDMYGGLVKRGPLVMDLFHAIPVGGLTFHGNLKILFLLTESPSELSDIAARSNLYITSNHWCLSAYVIGNVTSGGLGRVAA